MVSNKGRYGHPGGLLHAGLHVILSFAVMLVLGVPIGTALLVCFVEFIAHYHIDWGKEALSKRLGVGPDKLQFWKLHGSDQAAHHLTYIAMIWWVFHLGHLG